MTFLKATAAVCLSLAVSAASAAEKFSPPDFHQHVLPILEKYCLGCHSTDDPQGGLVLETYATTLEGGKKGPALVAGKSDESRLVLMIEGRAKPKMPPKNNPAPSKDELDVLKAWINAGAKPPTGPAPVRTFAPPKIAPRHAVRSPVGSIAFAPKGNVLAIGGRGVVTLVDPSTGYIDKQLDGCTGLVVALAFSPDGSRIIAAAGEPGLFGEVKIWNLADGKLIREIKGHKDSLYALAASKDGRWLATAGYDKDIRLWNAEDGKEVRVLKGHNDAVFDLAFSPNGKQIASASGDRTVKLWDVASGERLDTFSQATKDQLAVAFSPDGARVAGAGVDNRIRVWSISATGKEGTNPILTSRFAHQGSILRLAYSPDGSKILSASDDRTVKLWDSQDVRELYQADPLPEWPTAISFANDGASFAVGRHDGGVALFETKTGKKLQDVLPKEKPPAPPVLARSSIRGFESGRTAKISLIGERLKTAREVFVSNPAVQGKIVGQPSDGELQVELTSKSDLPRGSVSIGITTLGGKSGVLALHADDLPQTIETEPNDDPAHANHITLPTDFWGAVVRLGDVDVVSFDAKKGQMLVFELAAARIGSKLNASMALFDPSQRTVASSNSAGESGDPLFAYRALVDGRYTLRIGDLKLAGSEEHYYRLSIGSFPYVTGAFPLAASPHATIPIELTGYNLPPAAAPPLKTEGPGAVMVPLDPRKFRFAAAPKIIVGSFPEPSENEPNDAPAQATRLAAPGIVDGRLHRGPEESKVDVDLFRFAAKKGETWILETEAARLGSPIDTRLDVLDVAGKPVEQVWLQAVRDSAINFRNINSKQLEARVDNWQEMELNQFMYLQGEVCKLFRMPQGPDSGFAFYALQGRRRTYFSTTSTTHALGDPCYIVEAYPAGSSLAPNGLPMFKLHYANDDAEDFRLGSDSSVTFTAPADGEYLVRVSDSRGQQSERHCYRLKARKPAPDFHVSVGGMNPTVNASAGREIELNADRLDGFDGEIRIDVAGLPPGFSIAGPIVIQAGHLQAKASLVADAAAPALAKDNESATKLTASAMINGATVVKPIGGLGKITLAPKPKLTVRLEPAEIVVTPGSTTTVLVKVERNGFKGRINFGVENLPHGVIVDNIGLNGILIPEGQNERSIFLAARNWVPPTRRPFHAVAQAEGNPASPSVHLIVKDVKQLAEVSAPAKP